MNLKICSYKIRPCTYLYICMGQPPTRLIVPPCHLPVHTVEGARLCVAVGVRWRDSFRLRIVTHGPHSILLKRNLRPIESVVGIVDFLQTPPAHNLLKFVEVSVGAIPYLIRVQQTRAFALCDDHIHPIQCTGLVYHLYEVPLGTRRGPRPGDLQTEGRESKSSRYNWK